MKRARSTPVLVAIGAILAALVVADRVGFLPGRAVETNTADSPQGRYLQALDRRQRERALSSQAGPWRIAADRAQEAWAVARTRLVAAPTIELAEARTRELVLAALSDLKLASPPRVTYVKQPPADPAARVRPVGLRVDFDTASHRDVYLALDRLRYMHDAAVAITAITIDGPGRPQIPTQATVSITLRAAAIIGEDPA